MPVTSASVQATGITQSPRPAKIGHVMLSSITIAHSANVAPTDRSILPLIITMVMPRAMIPMGADCLNNNNMLSRSMNALSESDRNSPAMEKKINSRTMKPQIAPLPMKPLSVSLFMFKPSRNRGPQAAPLCCNVQPNGEDYDHPSHHVLDVKLQTHQQ